jgi:hypothetical protein
MSHNFVLAGSQRVSYALRRLLVGEGDRERRRRSSTISTSASSPKRSLRLRRGPFQSDRRPLVHASVRI